MSSNQKYNSVKRKAGDMVVLHVEVLVNQKAMLDNYSKKFDMSKSDIIAQALQLWFNATSINEEI